MNPFLACCRRIQLPSFALTGKNYLEPALHLHETLPSGHILGFYPLPAFWLEGAVTVQTNESNQLLA